MTFRILVAALLLTLAAPLAANDAVTFSKSYSVRVAVDEQGQVTSAEPLTEIPAELLGTVTALAEKSEFEPARVDGRPVPSRTTVHVRMRFEGDSRQVRAVPVKVSNGGKLNVAALPRYPFEAMRSDVGAQIWATLTFLADGSLDPAATRIDSVEVVRQDRSQRNSRHQAGFEAAVQAAIAQWTLLPDEVDGQPIAMTVRVPTRFCPPSRNRRGCDDLWPEASQPDPSPEPSDTDVRLATIKPAFPVADGG
jgi:outer membrane biosynthesis protein TonB